jgi:hypothetical protein
LKKLIIGTRKAADIMESQLDADVSLHEPWVLNAKRVITSTVDWAEDNETYLNMHSMPNTNETRKGKPKPTNVIGLRNVRK